jgi:hypothetical protein
MSEWPTISRTSRVACHARNLKIKIHDAPRATTDLRSDGINDQGQGHTTPLSVHVTPSWRHRQKGCPTGSV